MPRARSLKPGFFANEDLIELPFEWRLLFAGLWTLADREGRLEDRPKKIKLHIFPGDNVDVDRGLSALAERGFIVRYSVENSQFVQVVNWKKHQSPHVKEAASTIPAPCEHQTRTSVAALTPSSLTPDSGLRTAGTARQPPEEIVDASWDLVRANYPAFSGSQSVWLTAERSYRAAVEAGEDVADIHAGVKRYAEFCAATDRIPRHVKNPDRWFTDKQWREEWQPPPSKAQRQQDQNVSVVQEWIGAGK